MCVDVSWAVPRLKRAGVLWNVASSFTVVVVGLFTKAFIGHTATKTGTTVWFNKTTVFNKHFLTNALDNRPKTVPLVTISNHHSCFDDPGLWGKCIPVIRGEGVYQAAIDFCVDKLKEGAWVHIFPEGKVNMTKEPMRLKWGVGRLIFDSPVTPIVIPIWHEGMDDILPNVEPYVLQFKKKLTINYGEPLNLEDMVNRLKKSNASPEEARKAITDYLQEQLYQLRNKTLQLMDHNTNNNFKKAA